MKARIKATGEIVDLECCELLDDEERKPRTRQEYNKANSTHATCNWVEVRNQAAIAALGGLLADPAWDSSTESMVKCAIGFANELVRQLKGK